MINRQMLDEMLRWFGHRCFQQCPTMPKCRQHCWDLLDGMLHWFGQGLTSRYFEIKSLVILNICIQVCFHFIHCFAFLLRAFDKSCKGFLRYEDLISGFAAMEPVTPHGGCSGEIRSVYILRYYDTVGHGYLSYDNFW